MLGCIFFPLERRLAFSPTLPTKSSLTPAHPSHHWHRSWTKSMECWSTSTLLPRSTARARRWQLCMRRTASRQSLTKTCSGASTIGSSVRVGAVLRRCPLPSASIQSALALFHPNSEQQQRCWGPVTQVFRSESKQPDLRHRATMCRGDCSPSSLPCCTSGSSSSWRCRTHSKI